MRRTITSAALAAILLNASAALASAVDVPVSYDVDDKALRSGAPAGTLLTVELHALSDCTDVAVHSELLAVEALKIEALKAITPKDATKAAKTDRLTVLLSGVSLPENAFLKVSGSGITPVGGACQAQALTSGLPGETGATGPGVCVPDPTASPRFVDNLDGTVSDRTTCLMWEQKNSAGGGSDLANPHDAENPYQWSSSGTAADGAAFTDFLSRVNGTLCAVISCTGLAGHTDWRLPTGGELSALPFPTASALLPEGVSPVSSLYWSASTSADNSANAWVVGTFHGIAANGPLPKTSVVVHARAVRFGS